MQTLTVIIVTIRVYRLLVTVTRFTKRRIKDRFPYKYATWAVVVRYATAFDHTHTEGKCAR